MFNPVKEVPSIELCKKLKEIGYPQGGGGWYWAKNNLIYIPIFSKSVQRRLEIQSESEVIKAPTVVELGELLIKAKNLLLKTKGNYQINYFLRPSKTIIVCDCGSFSAGTYKQICHVEADTEANARAKAIIQLVESGYIEI